MAKVLKDPKVVLKAGAVYLSDNGRAICVHCAGMSAKFTGRDISGQKVERVGCEDAAYWEREFGKAMACEAGCTVLTAIAGPDGWPAVKS